MDAPKNVTSSVAKPFLVVGIGASAGGLEALERFFDNLPSQPGMAFVVIQHLSPDFKSLMDELLSRHTDLPIKLATEGMLVEPDHVYLLPPKKVLVISGGRLLLSERQQELSLPIDVFFRSLARDCGRQAVGIVLSGGGSDGSRGARDIRDSGGVVIVQDVASAQFDGMPKTARDAGVADWVLEPAQMPRILLERAAGVHELAAVSDSGVVPAPTGIHAVYKMLQDEYGIDFTLYKPSTVTRRIERRLNLAQSSDLQEYVERLRSQREELDVLYRDLLIGVTRFFRDPKAFELLEQQVLPQLLMNDPRTPLRVWVAGCATGEEAYSLAITLQDLLLELDMPERQVKIFATDVHRGSLERATRALYDADAVANVSPERLERYFVRVGSSYQVVPDLRSMIVFAAHNVIKDAPFTKVDLVSCRNLLIYLQPSAQQRALSLFHFALNKGGVLLLGASESAGALINNFETVDKHWRIYRRQSDRPLVIEPRLSPRDRPKSPAAFPRLEGTGRYSLTQLLGTYDALLDTVMPPSLLVSERGELVHAFNGGSRLLQMRDGRQGLEVLDMVGPELKMVLVGGLKRALAETGPVVFKGVRLGGDDGDRPQRLTMRRILNRSGGPRHVLITCEPMEGVAASGGTEEREIDLDQVSREQLGMLEAELSHTKENLQAAIEELETSNEELQASNEELQASNEELQSTNEELQSVNEELYTVNSEYQRKIAELTELTNDMDNLFSSTDIGTIFLDRQLRIRRFTPQIADAFSLVAHDVGRSIETFAHRLEHPELLDDLRRVRETGEPAERELRGSGGKAFFSRILPYRAKGAIDGVVLTLIDVSGLKAAEDALFHERYLLNSLLFSVPDAIYFKDSSGRFIRANPAMAERLGVDDPRELIGKVPYELPNRDHALLLHDADQAVLQSGEVQHYKLEQRERPDGVKEWDLVTRLPLRDPESRVVGVIAIFRSVTEQKLAEEKIQEAVRRRDQFLAMLSHELRNPLGAMVTATALLQSDAQHGMQPRLLDVLERQSQQMAHLLDDLLEASRVTQNKIELRCTVLDVRSAIHEAIDAVRARMDGRQLRFTASIPDEPLHVNGDPIRLQQIYSNLLSNAAKYTPPGGSVHVELVRDGNEACVTVRDTGAGIAPDMLESVFEMFVQSHLTLDRSAGGLGVGLTLARSLVSLHGGTICACSEGEGKGSQFIVRLPLAEAVQVAKPHDGHPAPRTARGTKVVVVEDSEDSRELLCVFLRRAGFECHAAESGTAAIELMQRERPDIAILDVGLPGIDGYEVARRVRRDPVLAHVVLIALTGYGRASDREASRAAGFDEHLVKPVKIEQLLAALGRADQMAATRMN
ncbi:MAG: chemotaxis protein CheB [Polyangiales bacterium]